ncbi:MAG: transposase [Kofleriaceae bacterium]
MQTAFRSYAKKLDKNGQLRGARKGEKREGVGRPKRHPRASERHQVRPPIKPYEPQHVTMRAHADVSLRKHEVFRAVREATFAAAQFDERARTSATPSSAMSRLGRAFHIVHFSIQRTHIHLLVEASDRTALSKGMQAFGISAARQINARLRARTGQPRKGSVFADRYHVRPLKTPRQVRNCLLYVLNNWKHHGEYAPRDRNGNTWRVDPYSSGPAFDGWKQRDVLDASAANPYAGPLVWLPKTWLLAEGWRRYGLLDVDEIPGHGPE